MFLRSLHWWSLPVAGQCNVGVWYRWSSDTAGEESRHSFSKPGVSRGGPGLPPRPVYNHWSQYPYTAASPAWLNFSANYLPKNRFELK